MAKKSRKDMKNYKEKSEFTGNSLGLYRYKDLKRKAIILGICPPDVILSGVFEYCIYICIEKQINR